MTEPMMEAMLEAFMNGCRGKSHSIMFALCLLDRFGVFFDLMMLSDVICMSTQGLQPGVGSSHHLKAEQGHSRDVWDVPRPHLKGNPEGCHWHW